MRKKGIPPKLGRLCHPRSDPKKQLQENEETNKRPDKRPSIIHRNDFTKIENK